MRKYYSPLIGAALAAASLFHFSLPAFAIGTSAGTQLRNSATATYDDQDNERYNVTSNEVTVTVGKIAGITNVPSGFTDNTVAPDNSEILPGDSVSFDFEVTNTGNDVTDIFIPEASNIRVENLIVTGVQYSDDDGATFNDRSAAPGGVIQGVEENTSITVRVNGTVSNTAARGDDILVQLGDTGTNTADLNSTDFSGTQNQPDIDATVANDVQARDVRTVTADSPPAEVAGDPVNGQREASATQIKTIGSAALAMPIIEKVNAGVDDGGTPADLSDNVVTYNLNLEVAGDSDPQVVGYADFPYNAADLEGRDYSTGARQFTIAGLPQAQQTNLILVSDAVPANTTIDIASVTAPNGNWTPVYTVSPLTTPADEAVWTDDPSGLTAANITRVGWVYNARATTLATNPGNGSIAAGSSVTGFNFDVVTTGLSNTATAIYNIAQIFGSTDNNEDGTGGLIVYDESGDQNPTNLSDDGTFGPDETATTTITDINDIDGDGNTTETLNVFGYDNNVAEANQDPNNDNTGTGDAGEYNTVTVAPNAVTSDILNGPDGSPAAVGDIFGVVPADDNHDFQNLAAPSPAPADASTDAEGDVTTTYDPAPVEYTNTVRNPADSGISDVILEPVSPTRLNLGGNAADLPDGTEVTITYGNQSATYLYDPADPAGIGSFEIQPGATGTGANGTVVIPTIALQSNESYTVSVDLPDGTPLSTNYINGNPADDLVGGFPVPVVAYLDDDNRSNGGIDGPTVADTYNVVVNQVYTGYLQLVKEARVLRDNGNGNYAPVPGMGYGDPDDAKLPAPGDILEYRITYTNISDDGSDGSGNGLLLADDIVITEDGIQGDNNWAEDNDDPAEDGDSLMDTLHVLDGAVDSTTGSTILYFNAAGASSTNPGAFSTEINDFGVTDDITKYEVRDITRINPGSSGTFTFQRKITNDEDIENLTPQSSEL